MTQLTTKQKKAALKALEYAVVCLGIEKVAWGKPDLDFEYFFLHRNGIHLSVSFGVEYNYLKLDRFWKEVSKRNLDEKEVLDAIESSIRNQIDLQLFDLFYEFQS